MSEGGVCFEVTGRGEGEGRLHNRRGVIRGSDDGLQQEVSFGFCYTASQ